MILEFPTRMAVCVSVQITELPPSSFKFSSVSLSHLLILFPLHRLRTNLTSFLLVKPGTHFLLVPLARLMCNSLMHSGPVTCQGTPPKTRGVKASTTRGQKHPGHLLTQLQRIGVRLYLCFVSSMHVFIMGSWTSRINSPYLISCKEVSKG